MFSSPKREHLRTDDSHLPRGDCRYILLHPEFKGLRCGCVGFSLNRAIPGSTCDCGHQACYHSLDKDSAHVERQELQALKEKVGLLEAALDKERYGGGGGLVDRLGRLEALLDKSRAETESEMKSIYRGIGGLWNNVGLLNKRATYYDDRLEACLDDIQSVRNRLIEIDDASIQVEERVDALEESATAVSPISRRRRASTPPSTISETPRKEEPEITMPLHLILPHETELIQSFRAHVAAAGAESQAWTVHVSLLPTSSQPFPFEKDTAAYKRCLSRGLHQMIVIPDSDGASFTAAINTAFSETIRGRSWQPLVARLCDAGNLRGLPMLRQLPGNLLDSDYNAEFLRSHCAIVDEAGKILDLYIAMSKDTISWAELMDLKPFTHGLESSWIYDPHLDGLERENSAEQHSDVTRERLSATGLLSNLPASLKRKASEISSTPNFRPAKDAESAGVKAKVRRPCTLEAIGQSRRAEAV